MHGASVVTTYRRRDRALSRCVVSSPAAAAAHARFGAPLRFAVTIVLAAVMSFSTARAETLVVVEARGIASTAGAVMDSASHLTLRPGEHVRLIGENGNQYCLDGPYDGPAKPSNGAGSAGWLSKLMKPGEHDEADSLTDCVR